ncbi:MAG: polysaccharide biosynthesis protein [Bryobacterales bacterium]|nr:polysaccharide biosynthesis protein [Bryobacterales bacterium]
MTRLFRGKRILITGGTGSLGKVLTRNILANHDNLPKKITIFSRDEAKQHEMRLEFRRLQEATEEIKYADSEEILEFRIGDVRNFSSVASAIRQADIVMNAAALKQVPNCEYFPYEAVQTNIEGAENIVRAIETLQLPVETVVGISTDKACKPVNVMGMSKAIQERIFVQANLRCPNTRFICVRYGNVLASRGSVIPLFQSQIRAGGPVTITNPDMTRFLLSLNQAVQTIFDGYARGARGDIFVPRIRSSQITNIARAMIAGRNIKLRETGIRPGEKVHEVLVAEDEAYRTATTPDYYIIKPLLPELMTESNGMGVLRTEYSSHQDVMNFEETVALLTANRLMVEEYGTRAMAAGELLR